jgi:hypothetical protein
MQPTSRHIIYCTQGLLGYQYSAVHVFSFCFDVSFATLSASQKNPSLRILLKR